MAQAFEITLLGMGGVFFFLYLMTEVLDLMRLTAGRPPVPAPAVAADKDLNQVAAAVAAARRHLKK